MRKPLMILMAAFLAAVGLVNAQEQPAYLSPDDLDNLLAPVALYPDPLVAQILPAATFPDQIDEAAQFLQANGDPNAIDIQPWDVSVQALAHYPRVVYMMASRLDWTTELGQAYVNQPDDVMNAIQRLRREARAAGNLVNTRQQEVVMDGNYIDIWPAEPEEIYVPIYDPSVAYFGSGGIYGGPVVTFSPGFMIGAWLNFDCDWRDHRVFYHHWQSDKGWIARALPYVHITPNYVNNRFETVPVNRGVVNRTTNRNNVARFDSVHRQVATNRPPATMDLNRERFEPSPARPTLPAPVARPAVPVQAPPVRMERPVIPAIRAGSSNFRAPMVSQVAPERPAQPFRPAPTPGPAPRVSAPHFSASPAPRPMERAR